MIKKLLVGLLVLGVAMAGAAPVPALALAEGAYVVSNNTHYVNPDTGAADDGGDTSTGEAMCRNTVYGDSLYELKNGKHYLTIRLKMRSFIKDIKFYVQQTKGDSTSYQKVPYEVVGGNKEEDTEDFRFEMPATDVLINPGFFVGPMNRDVTFFVSINLSSAQKDNGTFAAFNHAGDGTGSDSGSKPAPEQPAQPTDPVPGPDEPGSPLPAASAPTAAGEPKGPEEPADSSPNVLPEDGGEEVQGIVEFGGEAADDPGADQESAASPSFLLIGLAVVVCLGAGGYFFYLKRVKK